jgi:hypothetical protein
MVADVAGSSLVGGLGIDLVAISGTKGGGSMQHEERLAAAVGERAKWEESMQGNNILDKLTSWKLTSGIHVTVV